MRISHVEDLLKIVSVCDLIPDNDLKEKIKKEQIEKFVESNFLSQKEKNWLKYDLGLMTDHEVELFFGEFYHSDRMCSCVVLYNKEDIEKANKVFIAFDQYEYDYMHDTFFNINGLAEYNKKFEIQNFGKLLFNLHLEGIKIKDYIIEEDDF